MEGLLCVKNAFIFTGRNIRIESRVRAENIFDKVEVLNGF